MVWSSGNGTYHTGVWLLTTGVCYDNLLRTIAWLQGATKTDLTICLVWKRCENVVDIISYLLSHLSCIIDGRKRGHSGKLQ